MLPFTLFLIIAILLLIDEHILWQIDIPFARTLSKVRSTDLDSIMGGISFLGNGSVVTLAVLVAMWWLGRRFNHKVAWSYAGFMVTGSFVMMNLLKLFFQRSRPPEIHRLIGVSSYSFPSGHSINAFLLFSSLMVMTYFLMRKKAHRRIIYIISVLMILLIGLSRIYLGVHYLTDVIAGYSIAATYLLLNIAFFGNKVYTMIESSKEE